MRPIVTCVTPCKQCSGSHTGITYYLFAICRHVKANSMKAAQFVESSPGARRSAMRADGRVLGTHRLSDGIASVRLGPAPVRRSRRMAPGAPTIPPTVRNDHAPSSWRMRRGHGGRAGRIRVISRPPARRAFRPAPGPATVALCPAAFHGLDGPAEWLVRRIGPCRRRSVWGRRVLEGRSPGRRIPGRA